MVKHKKNKIKLNMRLSEDIQVEELFPDEEFEQEEHIRMKSHPAKKGEIDEQPN